MSDPDARFAIVEIPPNGPTPADTIIVGGPLSILMENLPDTVARNDAEARLPVARLWQRRPGAKNRMDEKLT
jgi:hypothetical protein